MGKLGRNNPLKYPLMRVRANELVNIRTFQNIDSDNSRNRKNKLSMYNVTKISESNPFIKTSLENKFGNTITISSRDNQLISHLVTEYDRQKEFNTLWHRK